jgi:hypothetical protein
MYERSFICAIAVFVLTTCLLSAPTGRAVASETALAQSTPDRTQMMQQSDHLRRLEEKREARAEHEAEAEVEAAVDSQSAGLDYVVLTVLIASAAILILISTSRHIFGLRR